MFQYSKIHLENPRPRPVRRAVEIVKQGGIITMSTDLSYVLACYFDNKTAVERVSKIRELDDKQLLLLLVCDLSELANFSMVDDYQTINTG